MTTKQRDKLYRLLVQSGVLLLGYYVLIKLWQYFYNKIRNSYRRHVKGEKVPGPYVFFRDWIRALDWEECSGDLTGRAMHKMAESDRVAHAAWEAIDRKENPQKYPGREGDGVICLYAEYSHQYPARIIVRPPANALMIVRPPANALMIVRPPLSALTVVIITPQ